MWNVEAVRKQFPALRRRIDDRPVIYLDGPAGSQVPQRVADAVTGYLLNSNANQGGGFATADETDAILANAQQSFADFLGAESGDCVSFGANMTSLTFALSRALAKTWKPGDEIIVTRLDHDANVTPWTLAARDAGVTVKHLSWNPDDCTLDLKEYDRLLNDRTRLVAFAYASNAVGTITPAKAIIERAQTVGATTFVDAVHYAPHGRIDVSALGCDFLACSAYKFFGPHIGVLYGKRDLLESLTPYKLRPATNRLPGKWMTGTQSHEGIAGAAEAVRYLADLGRGIDSTAASQSAALDVAFDAIVKYERDLVARLIEGLHTIPGLRIWGITDSQRFDKRVPTVSVTHRDIPPGELAKQLSNRGLFAWHGNHYALPFTEAAGLEPHGTLRLGLMHYNTAEEVDECLRLLESITSDCTS